MDVALAPRSWLKEAKKNAGWLIALGIALVIVGILAIGSPIVAGVSVSMVVGSMLIFVGVGQLIGAVKAGSFGSGFLGFIGGALTSIVGVAMLFRPFFGLATLTLLLAVYFFVEGISSIALGLKVRPHKGWGWLVFSGALGFLLGVFIYRQWPLSGVWAIGTMVGIHILFRGWSLIAIGMAARSGVTELQEALKEG